MKKALVLCAMLAASCSGKGEIIPVPSPEPQTPTTTGELTSAVLPPDLTIATTTTEPAPTTTTEPVVEVSTTVAPVTTVRVRATTTTEYLRSVTTIAESPSLDYGGWAIPAYIVMCESGGRWDAYNASGASGPYQLMPLHFGGELAMNQSREAQHTKAAELWNGGKGKSHWSACL